jgi:hypothetical protein
MIGHLRSSAHLPGGHIYGPFWGTSESTQLTTFVTKFAEITFHAVSALRGVLRDAELIGKTDNCYVTFYRGAGPDLKPW